MQHVTQQQKGEVDGARGVDQRNRIQSQTQTEGVVSLTLVGVAKQHQNTHNQTELACHARKARVEGFGKQSDAQAHGEHGVGSCTVSVHGTHHAQEKDEQRVVAEMEHRLSGIQAGQNGHPSSG